MHISLTIAIVCASGIATARPAMKPEAQQHLDRGTQLYNVQDYDAAIAEFQAGYLVEPRAEFLYAIGQAYRMKGDCERATRSYTETMHAPDGASLAAAAQRNITRCKQTPVEPPPVTPPTVTPPAPVPVALPSPPPPTPAPPWYQDGLGDALVVGGLVLAVGGTIVWKTGYDEASRTRDAQSYEQWLASYHDAEHAQTLQRSGTLAAAAGGVAVVAGVLHYIWASSPVEATVTPSSVTAQLSLAF